MLFFSVCFPLLNLGFCLSWVIFFFFCWWDLEWLVSVWMQCLPLSQGPAPLAKCFGEVCSSQFNLIFWFSLWLSSVMGIDFWLTEIKPPGKGGLYRNVKVVPCTPDIPPMSHQPGLSAVHVYSHTISSLNSYIQFVSSLLNPSCCGDCWDLESSKHYTEDILLPCLTQHRHATNCVPMATWFVNWVPLRRRFSVLLCFPWKKIAGGPKARWWVDIVIDFWPFMWQ